MKCSRCGHDNPHWQKFCGECGSRLAVVCATCGSRDNAPGQKFCGECGAVLAGATPGTASRPPGSYTPKHLAEKILTSRAVLEGERKVVTVLFCDLAGSTGLAERLGAEPMHTLLSRFFEIAVAEVHRYEGTVNQFLGDGFMALFGAPVAHEDHARRAVLAALGIQRAIREQARTFPLPEGAELILRMGLNTGAVVVGKIGDDLRMDYTAVGDTTNLAARLQQAADPGSIVLSETTRRLVREPLRLEALGQIQVKGRSEPVQAFSVIGRAPRPSAAAVFASRRLGQFVGRHRELATLEEVSSQVEHGQGHAVGIVGDPGAGKSRVLHEFRERLTGRNVLYFEGRCLSYGSSIPYGPILDIVRDVCGIEDADTSDVAAEKVDVTVEALGMDRVQQGVYLLHLLGVKHGTDSLSILTPEAIRERTFETLKQMSLRGSRRRSLVLALEDLHWVDRTSEQYLSSLVDSLAGASILLIATYRPGYRPPWLERSYATQLALRPLSPVDGVDIVRAVDADVPASVAHVILQRAEGNPFFIEELTRAMSDHAELAAAAAVPDTIHGVLTARIDRLPDDVKRLLQTASILGREFTPSLLREIWRGAGDPDRHLAELRRAEFLYERTTGEEAIHVFKHALTHDVAYETLLESRRAEIHEAAGQALERVYASRLDTVYDRLAHHYARSDRPDKAVEYLSRFAERASAIYADAEAVVSLDAAVAHAERLPVEERDRRVVELVTQRAMSLHFLGRRQEAVDVLERQRPRVEALAVPLLVGRFHNVLGRLYSFLGRRDEAGRAVACALEAATRSADVVTMGQSRTTMAVECWFAGRSSEAIVHAATAVDLLSGTDEQRGLGLAYYVLAYCSAAVGDWERALAAGIETARIGELIGSRRLQSNGFGAIGFGRALLAEHDAAIAAYERALDLSPDAFETALILGFLGDAFAERGDVDEAVPMLERAVKEADRLRSTQVRGWFAAALGRAYLLCGRRADALGAAERSLALCREASNPQGIGGARRLLGNIALADRRFDDAAEAFRESLDIFASCEARAQVAQVHLDLARLGHALRDATAVAAHLDEARRRFTALRIPKRVELTEKLARELRS